MTCTTSSPGPWMGLLALRLLQMWAPALGRTSTMFSPREPPAKVRESLPPRTFCQALLFTSGVRHSQSVNSAPARFVLRVLRNLTVVKLCGVTLGLLLDRITLKRPSVAWSPQPSTTMLPETGASRRVQVLVVHCGGGGGNCACALVARTRATSAAASRAARQAGSAAVSRVRGLATVHTCIGDFIPVVFRRWHRAPGWPS